MSGAIDERVVSMQFDNKQFESNVQTSLGTLDKLKQSLNFTGATKGLEDIEKASRGCNFAPMISAVEAVGVKFNAMYTIADHALRRITDRIMTVSENMIKSLSVDQIMAGWTKYEQKTSSVQTIMNATGKSIDEVNSYLNKLMWYSDETSYGFTDMTASLAQLTSAGGNIDNLIPMIEGIANATAFAGKGANEFSRAIYNLNQSYSAGHLQYMDWKSLDLAGVSSQQLKQTFIDTAIAMGKLSKEGKTAKGTLVEIGNFGQTLNEKWADTEVMEAAFGKFSELTEAAYKAVEAGEYDTASDAIEALAGDFDELSVRAFKSAQEAKTFSEAIDATKDAVSSGWMKTAEIIFGNYDEAKVMWTDLANTLWDIFASGADARNELLEDVMISNWKKLTTTINDAGVTTEAFEEKVKQTAKDHGLDVDELIEKHGSLEDAIRSGAISTDILQEAVDGLSKSTADLSIVDRILGKGDKGDDVKEVQQALKDLGHDIGEAGIDGIIGKDTEAAIKAFQELKGLEVTGIVDDKTLEALREASKGIDGLSEGVKEYIDGIDKLGGRELILDSFSNIYNGIVPALNIIKTAFREVFPPLTAEKLYSLIEGFNELTKKFRLTAPQLHTLKKIFKGVFSAIDIGWMFVKELAKGIGDLLGNFSGLGTKILGVTGTFGNWISGIRDSAKETNLFGTVIGRITSFIQLVIDKIKQFCSAIKSKIKAPGFEGIVSLFKGLWNIIKVVGAKIGEVIAGIGRGLGQAFQNGDIDGAISILNGGLFTGILLTLKKFLSGGFKDLFETPMGMLDSIKDTLGSVKDALSAWQQDLQANTLLKIAGAIGILALSLLVIASMDPERLASSLGAITILFADLMGSLTIFTKISGKGMRGIGTAAAAMVGMSFAILILSFALKNLASLSWDELGRGMVGIFGLTAMVVAAAKILKSEEKTVISGMTSMVIFALAVKVLADVCKDLSAMSWEELARGGAGILGLTVIVVAAAKALSNSRGPVMKGAFGVAIFSLALMLIADVCKDLGSLSLEQLAKGLGAIGILLAVISKFAKSMPERDLLNMGASLAVIGFAVKIFASAIRDLGSLSLEQLAKGLGTIGILLFELTIFSKKMPEKDMLKMAASLTVIGFALKIFASAVADLGQLSIQELLKGLIAIGALFAEIAIFAKVMPSGGSLAKTGAGMVIMSAALLLMAPALKMLGSMSWGQIGRGLAALAGAFVILGVAGLLLGPLVPVLIGLAAALALIGVAVLAVGVGIMGIAAGFATLAGAGAIGAYAFVESLTIIITGIIGLIPAIAGAIGEAIVTICLVIAESAPALGGAVKALVLMLIDVLVECVPQLAEGALELLVELLAALVEYTPTIVNSLFQLLIGVLDGISANLPALIASGLGIFSAFVTGIIDGLGTVFESLGNAIGSAIGGVINGLLEGISASLPEVGTNLSTFMDNLGPFIEGVQGIDESTMTGITAIVSMITELTKAGLMDSIATFISGESSLLTFAQDIVPFGIAMKAFSIVVKGLDENAVTAAANAGKMLSGMVETIPKSGGVVGFFTGEHDIQGFAAGIVPFGTAIKQFADEVAGIDEAAVTAAANAGATMAAMVETIPNTGGVFQFFAGEHDMTKFSEGLVPFGTAIKSFSEEVKDIDSEAVTAAANAGTALSEMANTLPETGGIWQWFSGEQNMETFGNQLVKFGSGVKSFSEEVTGIDTDAVTAAAGVGTTMTTLADSITDGAIDNLAYFGGSMASFGTYFAQFADNVADVDTTSVSAVISQAYRLASMAKTFDGVDFTGLGTFGESLTNIGKTGIDGFVAAFEDASDRVNKAGGGMITEFLKGASEKVDNITKTFKSLADDAVTAIRDKWQRFYNAGKYVVDGFASGIKANGYKARDAAEAIADSVEATIREALKINSPSKVMIPIGGGIPEGLALGMDKLGGMVKDSAVSVAKNAIDGTKNAISRIADVVNSDIDAQPTIRPVLDLSEVTAGAGAINGMFGMTPSIGVMSNLGSISSSMNGRQNGANNDVITAIKTLGKQLSGMHGDTYTINGVTYDDGSNVSEAVKSLVRAAKVERRR